MLRLTYIFLLGCVWSPDFRFGPFLVDGFSPVTTPSSPFTWGSCPYDDTSSLLSYSTLYSGVSNNGDFDEEQFIRRQKRYSNQAQDSIDSNNDTRSTSKSPFKTSKQHLDHQAQVFNAASDFFDSEDATPDDVKPILKYLMEKVLNDMVESKEGESCDENQTNELRSTYNILDIGCGTGALFPYYINAANSVMSDNSCIRITGVDLAPEMVRRARINAAVIVAEVGEKAHEIDVRQGDFVQLVLGDGYGNGELSSNKHNDIIENEKTAFYRRKFDAVVINSCFGNFFNEGSVLEAASHSLKKNGILAITHPLGSDFVARLNAENPDTVPNLLPVDKNYFVDLCTGQDLVVLDVVKNADIDGKKKSIYYACAKCNRE